MQSKKTDRSDLVVGDHYDNTPLNSSMEATEYTEVGIQKSKPEKKERERIYYADWLRALSIHFVIMVHCD